MKKLTRREALKVAAITGISINTSCFLSDSNAIEVEREEGEPVVVDVFITEDGLYITTRKDGELWDELVVPFFSCETIQDVECSPLDKVEPIGRLNQHNEKTPETLD